MHKHATSLPSLCLRIDLSTDRRIISDKVQLLEAMEAWGSISAAGRAMHISYTKAWHLLHEINLVCGRETVDRQIGGKNGGGTGLTPFGVSLVARYRKIERVAAGAVEEDLRQLQSDIRSIKESRTGISP
jgi:molybdate transport system regulatory protein